MFFRPNSGCRHAPLPNDCFKKFFAICLKLRTNCGWAQEAALDIEWAQAMAPKTKIVLVEAATNSFANLFVAVDVATSEGVANGNRGEVCAAGYDFATGVGSDAGTNGK